MLPFESESKYFFTADESQVHAIDQPTIDVIFLSELKSHQV